MSVTVRFLGAADTVTGSKYLLEHDGHRVLVDCGLFQGYKQLRLRNWAPLGVDPGSIHAVLLTHAHIDHSGYLPLLRLQGFKGKIHATPATRDLCAILLPDSGHLQEEDAAFANRHGFSKHTPALPLYTRQDAVNCLTMIHGEAWHQTFVPAPGFKATFYMAGHILGASFLLIEVAGRRILFSGDLGRPDDVVMLPPENAPQADTVLIESTYGDRSHPADDVSGELGDALQRVAARGGVAVLPVFAVGRAQAVLHVIGQLKQQGHIPVSLPVFLDSPMAVSTTELYQRHPHAHRLDAADLEALRHSAHMIETPEASKALARHHGPMVILSASGMATGGRVLHHLALHLPDHRNMVILTGHQAEGTRGASLRDGASTVRIHGQDVPVRAEVVSLLSASAHADKDQLLRWLKTMPSAPGQVYVVHGERHSSDALRGAIEHQIGWRAVVPEHDSTWPA
jgi:metallo-beta-lactamase family protein